MKFTAAIAVISFLALIVLGLFIYLAMESYRDHSISSSIEYTQLVPTTKDTGGTATDPFVAERLAIDKARSHRLQQKNAVAQVDIEVIFEGDVQRLLNSEDNSFTRPMAIDMLVQDSIILQAGFNEGRIDELSEEFFNEYEKNPKARTKAIERILSSLSVEGVDQIAWVSRYRERMEITIYE